MFQALPGSHDAHASTKITLPQVETSYMLMGSTLSVSLPISLHIAGALRLQQWQNVMILTDT